MTRRSGTPSPSLALPCVPAIIEIAKYAGIGCLTGAAAAGFRSKFHVGGYENGGCRGSWLDPVHLLTGVLHVHTAMMCVLPRQFWHLGKADTARPRPSTEHHR